MQRRALIYLAVALALVAVCVGVWLTRRHPSRAFQDPDVQLAAFGLMATRSTCDKVTRFARTKAMDALRRLDPVIVAWKAANPGKPIAPDNWMPLFLDPAYRELLRSILPEVYQLAMQAVADLSACHPDSKVMYPNGPTVTLAQLVAVSYRITRMTMEQFLKWWDYLAAQIGARIKSAARR